MKQLAILVAAVGLGSGLGWSLAHAQDTAAAEALLKKSGCMKCHSVSADKEGPSFKKTAAKYKGQNDGPAKVQAFIAGGGKDHPAIKSKDEAAIKNAVSYILSR